MIGFWVGCYLVLATAALLHAALFLLQTWEHRRFARSRLGHLPDCRPTGRAMLLVPCKGLDVALEENLRRLFDQDYDDYEITFVVQDGWDPAYRMIERLCQEYPDRVTRLVVAGQAQHSSQKVHNLRAATRRVGAKVDYLVFVDSDAQPRREWLRGMIGRLDDPIDGRGRRVGAVTGYRWIIPVRGGLAGCLLSSLNAGITTLFGSRGWYPVWGGSWAIRRDVFESIGLREAWRDVLSDDLVASLMLRRHGLAVRFEPACVVASPYDGNLFQLLSFLRRQYLIGRVHLFAGWLLGLAGATLPNLANAASLVMLAWGLAGGGLGVWLPAAVLAGQFVFGVARALLHRSIARLYVPHFREQLRSAERFDLWAGPIVSLVNWLGMLASAVGRHVTWRGITYELFRAGRTRIVRRPPIEPAPRECMPEDVVCCVDAAPEYQRVA